MASTEQIVRVLALAGALSKTRQGITVRTFAEERGFPPRSVYRDIKALTAAGYPIVQDENHYKLMGDWQPPSQAGVDRDEALALMLATELLGSLGGTGFGPALERLWTKLGTAADSETNNPQFSVRPLSAIDYGAHEQTIATLKEALAKRQVARIVYQRPDLSEATERVVEAGELYLDPGIECLSLIAWCRLRKGVRSFAVHRISSVTLLGEHYQVRPEARSKNKLRGAFRAWSGDTIQTVKLRFAACVAREIEERNWHPSQQLARQLDNRLLLTMQISEPLELLRWLLGFGPDVEVLKPGWLAERVQQRHREALADPGDGSADEENDEEPDAL